MTEGPDKNKGKNLEYQNYIKNIQVKYNRRTICM